VCLELSVDARSKYGRKRWNKHKNPDEDDKDDHAPWGDKGGYPKKDFNKKISNPEMMMMMRMKKMLMPLRELFSKVNLAKVFFQPIFFLAAYVSSSLDFFLSFTQPERQLCVKHSRVQTLKLCTIRYLVPTYANSTVFFCFISVIYH